LKKNKKREEDWKKKVQEEELKEEYRIQKDLGNFEGEGLNKLGNLSMKHNLQMK